MRTWYEQTRWDDDLSFSHLDVARGDTVAPVVDEAELPIDSFSSYYSFPTLSYCIGLSSLVRFPNESAASAASFDTLLRMSTSVSGGDREANCSANRSDSPENNPFLNNYIMCQIPCITLRPKTRSTDGLSLARVDRECSMMPKRVLRIRATSFAVFALRYMTIQSPKERYNILKLIIIKIWNKTVLEIRGLRKIHGTSQKRYREFFLGIKANAYFEHNIGTNYLFLFYRFFARYMRFWWSFLCWKLSQKLKAPLRYVHTSFYEQ